MESEDNPVPGESGCAGRNTDAFLKWSGGLTLEGLVQVIGSVDRSSARALKQSCL